MIKMQGSKAILIAGLLMSVSAYGGYDASTAYVPENHWTSAHGKQMGNTTVLPLLHHSTLVEALNEAKDYANSTSQPFSFKITDDTAKRLSPIYFNGGTVSELGNYLQERGVFVEVGGNRIAISSRKMVTLDFPTLGDIKSLKKAISSVHDAKSIKYRGNRLFVSVTPESLNEINNKINAHNLLVAKAKEEAERREQARLAAIAQKEQEKRERLEKERLAKQEAEESKARLAQLEAQRKEEEARKKVELARIEAEKKAKLAKMEADMALRKAKEEAERKANIAKLEADRKATAEMEKRRLARGQGIYEGVTLLQIVQRLYPNESVVPFEHGEFEIGFSEQKVTSINDLDAVLKRRKKTIRKIKVTNAEGKKQLSFVVADYKPIMLNKPYTIKTIVKELGEQTGINYELDFDGNVPVDKTVKIEKLEDLNQYLKRATGTEMSAQTSNGTVYINKRGEEE
ncbi:MAG: hypothetical protein IE916_00300 [Epsilonproteobacteria bacterium]|nr:hypothetical protein [Campylobacterota bacterium]